MARNEELFPGAEHFTPERWLRDENNEIEINSFASQPFGYGSRSCIGEYTWLGLNCERAGNF